MSIALAEPLARWSMPTWLASSPVPDPSGGFPLLATPISASGSAPADEGIADYVHLDDYLIRQPETTVLIRVQGDALQTEGIRDGDLLVVDRATAPSTGSLVVAVVTGGLRLVQVGRNAQGQRVAESPGSAPGAPTGLDASELTIWGVVRWNIQRRWPARHW